MPYHPTNYDERQKDGNTDLTDLGIYFVAALGGRACRAGRSGCTDQYNPPNQFHQCS
ncbi:MAG TPA: hypothetical protein VJ933_11170 [Phaeodactylibacter sp.]|nr:hypothetical protein [Phaeodactylibacter sp.]